MKWLGGISYQDVENLPGRVRQAAELAMATEGQINWEKRQRDKQGNPN